MLATKTLSAIDKALEEQSGFRNHLGASLIGQSCARKLWYSFHWALNERHEGRTIRIFDRGQREEERVIAWLRKAGCQVWNHDEAGTQFRFEDCNGHFGGSIDGAVRGVPDLPTDETCLLEIKTHNDRSFNKLVVDGVEKAKPEHYIQCVVYCYKFNFKHALYLAVNKNDDRIHAEIIKADTQKAIAYITRAEAIITATEPPPRINDSPGWWECSYCQFKQICHFHDAPEINCRTCTHSTPAENRNWSCELNRQEVQFQTGCEQHVYNPHLLNGVEFLGGDEKQNYALLRLPNGDIIKHGPNNITSEQLNGEIKRAIEAVSDRSS